MTFTYVSQHVLSQFWLLRFKTTLNWNLYFNKINAGHISINDCLYWFEVYNVLGIQSSMEICTCLSENHFSLAYEQDHKNIHLDFKTNNQPLFSLFGIPNVLVYYYYYYSNPCIWWTTLSRHLGRKVSLRSGLSGEAKRLEGKFLCTLTTHINHKRFEIFDI